MSAASVRGRAGFGVRAPDGEGVLVDVITVQVVQMAIMQIIGVSLVLDGGVTAARAVGMFVLFVNFVSVMRH